LELSTIFSRKQSFTSVHTALKHDIDLKRFFQC
jgi:hypothetical protein